MIDWAKDAMQGWAQSRGLQFTEEGLLPPATDALRDGLGVGTRRAAVIREQTEHTRSARGGFTKRPERSTWNLCSGVLPGGIEGVVAHHVHLEHMRFGEGHAWYAVPRTVVYVELPERTRPVRWLTGGRDGGVSALGSVTVARGNEIVRVPQTRVEREGMAWTATPAEEPARVERLTAAASAALAATPQRTRVELRDGALCVVTPGAVEDPAVLDALCAVAAAIAGGAVAVTAGDPPLDPAAPVGPPAETPRRAWLRDGAARIAWPSPPESVSAAQAAYRGVAEQMARARGARWKIRLIALVAVLIGIALWIALDLAVMALFDSARFELMLALVFSLLLLVPAGLRAAWRAGGEIHHDEVTARALPWGLEAFAEQYAASRGLRLEDADEFRHRFRSPIPGAPVRVLYGDLGGGTRGWLVLWVDETLPQTRNRLLAVVPAPGGALAAPGYEAHLTEGMLVLCDDVSAEERSAARLDALRAAAAAAAPVPAG